MLQNNKLVVFPTSRAIREFIKSSDENRLLPKLLTIDTFFTKSTYFKDYTSIDTQERFLYLNEVITDIDLNRLGIIKNFSQFLKQSEYIFRFFNEISQEKVDINEIIDADIYEFYKEHTSILKTIYSRYKELLNQKKKIDKVNFTENYNINIDFLGEYEEIEIFFEGYFTNIEFEILQKISQNSRVIINLRYYIYNNKSIQKFIDLSLDLEIGFNYKIDLSKLEVIEKSKIVSNRVDTNIKAFNSRINQIGFVKKSIVDFINQGISVDKIVLITPDESFTKYLQMFDSEKYFNYAMGFSIESSNLYMIQHAIYTYINKSDEIQSSLLLKQFCTKEDIKEYIKTKNKIVTKELFDSYILFIKSFENNIEILEKFDEQIFKFSSMIFKNSIEIRFIEIIKIVQDITKEIKIDNIDGGAITVLGVLESRFVEYDAAIIVDFNEDNIPKKSMKDKFLSTNLKNMVNLPTPSDRENLQKYYYKRLSDSVKYLNISYVDSDSSKVSRFLNMLVDDNAINDISNCDLQYSQILYEKKSLQRVDNEIKIIFDEKAFEWSASSLKNYLECKRKFYLNNILRLSSHDISIRPKNYELGELIHDLLENSFKNFVSIGESKNRFDKLFNNLQISNAYLRFELTLWKRKLEQFFKNEENRFSNSLKVIDIEKSFRIDFEGVVLKGKIDRIDLNGNKYMIIDYKSSSSLKIDTAKSFEESVDFQLEFYFLALKSLYNIKDEFIKPFYYDLNKAKLLDEIMLFEKLEVLKKIIRDFGTKEVEFSRCENLTLCQYCDYKIICDR